MGEAYIVSRGIVGSSVNYIETEPDFVTNGLMFYVDAAKQAPSGTTWNDLSGRNQHVTLVNNPVYFPSLPENQWGYFETTSNQHMRTPGSEINVTRPFTAEIWIRIDSSSQRFSIMHKDVQYSVDLRPESNANTYSYADGSTWSYGSYGTRTATGIASTGVWKQIVYSKDNSNIVRVYVNGVFRDSRSFSSSFSNNGNPTWLYGYGYGVSSPPSSGMTGRISIARMYNRNLSDAEVAQNFNAHKGRYGL